MSIASEITRIKNNIAAAFTAIATAGGTVPQDPTSDDLATSIESIPTGGDSDTVGDMSLLWNNTNDFKAYISGTEIPSSAFQSKSKLISIEMPNVVTIGVSAFEGCSSLVLSSLPEGITEMRDRAFMNCSNIAFTSLPIGLITITSNTFVGCPKLAISSIPDGVTTIEMSAFQNCTGITRLRLPKSLTRFGQSCFYGCNNIRFFDLTAFDSTDADFAVPILDNMFALPNVTMQFYFKDQATLEAFAAATNWASRANEFTTDPVPSEVEKHNVIFKTSRY